MKSIFLKTGLVSIILILFFSCKNQKTNSYVENSTDSSQTVRNEIKKPDKFKYPTFIIAVDATPDYDSAKIKVENLKKDFPEAGFLWIPDYKTLSGKEKYAVYTDSDITLEDLWNSLDKTKKVYPYAYIVLAADTGKRITVFDKFDYRIDGQRINLIMTYDDMSVNKELTPEEEEEADEYEEESGDWGYFVSQVQSFFDKATDKVVFLSSYKTFSPKEVDKLTSEIDGFEPDSWGYIMVKADGEKIFVPHDMPFNVIKSAVEFFDLPFNDEQINSLMSQ